ncbi:MAG TPA: TIGR00645 family protein [Planctomycetota bacterium]|nr:TIGR00645 family protein [Planctomycetota bacterium]
MLKKAEHALEHLIFWNRWLQAPIYVGLILAQVLYCYKFAEAIIHLILETSSSVEMKFLLSVLTLIDIAMVANLITMVVIGGYATFVSKLDLDKTADKPDWLEHIDPGAIKIKLATSLVGISSIHLLKSFIEVGNPGLVVDSAAPKLTHQDILWQVVIHMTFVVSTLLLALSEFIMHRRYPANAAPLTAPPDKNL